MSIPAAEILKEKIDRLNTDSWAVRVSNSVQAFEWSREAMELSRSITYKRGLAEALRTYGFCHIRLARHREAWDLLQESLQLFEEAGDLKGQSDVLEYFGIINRSFGNFDLSLERLYRALELRLQINYQEGVSLSYYHLGVTYKYLGNFEKALDYLLQSLAIAKEIRNWVAESYSLNLIGQIYFETNDLQQALDFYQQSLAIRRASGDQWGEAGCLDNIGHTFYQLGLLEEAVQHCTESLVICRNTNDKKGQGNALYHISQMYQQMREPAKALSSASESLYIRQEIDDKKGQAEVLLHLAELSLSHSKDQDEPLELLRKALSLGNETKALDLLSKIHYSFYRVYKDHGYFDKALVSIETYNGIEKQLHKEALAEKIINLQTTHRAEQAQKEAEIYRLRNTELAGLYEEIKKQKEETEIQKQKALASLAQLKETQAQLIQKEKMASLGELTAGIAHEIQNPLNFVNNFSEVNTELLEEMKEEVERGNIEGVKTLAGDIGANQEKISYHGKRADGIVKSMLQHSRISTGEKQLTDLNALAEKYLYLSFHGIRAKDASFAAILQTDFDTAIEKINLIPQDLGRALLNLTNNAFYAVAEKKKQSPGAYEPSVSLSTKKLDTTIEIRVKDNGNGVPQKLVDKIFQPFFTTKPAGQGTGLGLSLSFDIIKKHEGELSVRSREGEGSEFIISLPIQS